MLTLFKNIQRLMSTFKYNETYESSLINRFKSRLYKGTEFNVSGIIMNNNKESLEKFKSNIKDREVVQLYHCTDNYNYHENFASICDNGFHIGSASNKGYGIYFASHSLYAQFWGGNNHVIVCNIIIGDGVNKFYSEIYSENNNWGYVVTDKFLIYPVALIEFTSKSNSRERK